MAEDSGQTSYWVTRPGEDITTHLTHHGHADWHTAVWCSSCGTPGSDSAAAPASKGAHLLRLVRWTRKRRQGNKQRAYLVIQKHQLFRLSSHSGMLRDLQEENLSYRSSFKREGVDIICIQETHLTDAHHFTPRGYKLFQHDRADRHERGIVTLIRNTVPAVEVGISGGDSEYFAIRVVVQGREITVINYYCPPDKDLPLHTLRMVNHNLLHHPWL